MKVIKFHSLNREKKVRAVKLSFSLILILFSSLLFSKTKIITKDGFEYEGKLRQKSGKFLFLTADDVCYKVEKNWIERIYFDKEEIDLAQAIEIIDNYEDKINWNKISRTEEIRGKKEKKSFFGSLFNDFKEAPKDFSIVVNKTKNLVFLSWKDIYKKEKNFIIEKKIAEQPWQKNYAVIPRNKILFEDEIKTFNEPIYYRLLVEGEKDKSPYSKTCEAFIFKDSLKEVPETLVHDKTEYKMLVAKNEVTTNEYCNILNYAYKNNLLKGNFENNVSVKNVIGYPKELIDLDDSECPIYFFDGKFQPKNEKDNLPITEVSWFGAVFYCNVLNLKYSDLDEIEQVYNLENWSTINLYSNGYRLPTDLEWEFLASYNDDWEYPWGNDIPTDKLLNFSETKLNKVSEVNKFSPFGDNSFGISGLGGNVSEWCNNNWTFSQSNLKTRKTKYKAICGGNFESSKEEVKIKFRRKLKPKFSLKTLGFRIIRINVTRNQDGKSQ